MKTILVFVVLLSLIYQSQSVLIVRNNGCECQGEINCECTKDISNVMRVGQERLMFKFSNKEKNFIQEMKKKNQETINTMN